MSSINQLTETDTFSSGDHIAISKQGNDRKITGSNFLNWITASLNLDNKKDSFTTQYSAPNATAFEITVNNDTNVSNDSNAWLIITPDAAYADLTIKLPVFSDLADKQEVLVNCTQAVTTLTLDKNGADSIIGAPTTLSANDTFKLKYDKPFKKWYKVA